MNWLKRRLRKWLDVPNRHALSVDEMTKIVGNFSESPWGRAAIRKEVLAVLGLEVRDTPTIGKVYRFRRGEDTTLRDALKAIVEECQEMDLAEVRKIARQEGGETARRSFNEWTGELFIDNVVERINKKRVHP